MGLNEELATAEWIVSQVENDATLASAGVHAYNGVIPDEAGLPAVRFHVQGRLDTRGASTPAARIMTTIDWLIVLVREGLGIAALVPLANALDGALHDKSGSTTAVQILKCVRLEPFTLLDIGDTGLQYRHAGGLYRTIVTKV